MLSAGRAVVIGLLGVLVGVGVAYMLGWVLSARQKGGKKIGFVQWCVMGIGLVVVAGPMGLPSLVVGYAWGDSGVASELGNVLGLPMGKWFVKQAWLAELLYGVLLLGRYGVVSGFVMRYGPSGGHDGEGVWWAKRVGGVKGFWMGCQGWIGSALIAFCGVFLLVFGEFEIASLMGRPTWSVWLFDAQVGGLDVGRAMLNVVWPMGLQVLVVGGCAVWYLRREGRIGVNDRWGLRDEDRCVSWKLLAGAGWCLFAFLMVVGLPMWYLMSEGVAGVRGVIDAGMFEDDLWYSGVYALIGTMGVGVILIAMWWVMRRVKWMSRGGADVVIGGVAAMGLCGGLIVGMVLVSFRQWFEGLTGNDFFSDVVVGEWLLIGMGLMVVLLPMGWVLGLLARAKRERQSIYVAKMMWGGGVDRYIRWRGFGIWWRKYGRVWYWVGAYVFFQGFFELSASAVLYPAGGTPAGVRMYNLMHYGQSQVLSGMVLLSLLACGGVVLIGNVVVGVAVKCGGRFWFQWAGMRG
ncbi:hypothetical protein KS4_04020 [Poriferisphaera corsica]|uniref:Uncharacterized protein n=2 Tax=Poriferisphaera corsica TaxID=2528020 RepID=A0A517YQ69_9BACT|nr:hypothetical protein KS4_04020 [Poriferisphaera corsica]